MKSSFFEDADIKHALWQKEIKKLIEHVQLKQGDIGERGEKGNDGKNPIIISQTPPQDPEIGDLWYQP